MTAALDLADDFGAGGIVKLHADLEIRLFTLKVVKEAKGFLHAGKVACDDDVSVHTCAPPIMSVRF